MIAMITANFASGGIAEAWARINSKASDISYFSQAKIRFQSVLHTDDGPTVLLRLGDERIGECADLCLGQTTAGPYAYSRVASSW